MKLNKNRGLLGGLRDKITVSRALKTSCLAFAVFLLAFVFVPYIVSDANAESAQVSLKWRKVVLELDTGSNSGNVNYGLVSPTAPSASNYGTLAVQKKTLTVNTSGKYFNVYLSMDSKAGGDGTKKSLCYGFDASQEFPCNGQTPGINPVTEDNGNPAALQTNGWGYAIPGATGFSAVGNYDTTTGISSESTGNTSAYGGAKANVPVANLYTAKWAEVPVYSDGDTIWEASTNNDYGFGNYTIDGVSYSTPTTDSNNTLDVYYGVMVNTNTVAGTYGNKILYTAVASASSLNSPSKNLLSGRSYGGPTDRTRLYMDIDGDIAESDIKHVYLVKHSDAATVDTNNSGSIDTEAEATSLASYYVEDVNNETAECSVVSGSIDEASGETGTYGFSFECEMPDLGSTAEGVGYDFVVEVSNARELDLKYVSYDRDMSGKFTYAGLQTRVGGNTAGNQHYVKTMQEMSAGVCKMTNQWSSDLAYIGGQTHNLTQSVRQTYYNDHSNSTLGESTAGNYGTPTLKNAYGGEKWTDVDGGSYALTDTRDGKSYLVRKLADGNCWMVQNLDLELYADVQLDSTNTDLGYDSTTKSYPETAKTWTPISGVGNDATGDSIDNTDWKSQKGFETVTLIGYVGDTPTTIATCTGGTEEGPCFVKRTATGEYTLKKLNAESLTKAETTTGITISSDSGICKETKYTGGCKVETNYTNGTNYVITQYDGMAEYTASTVGGKTTETNTGDWRWDQTGSDGAHVYDQGPVMYRNTFADDHNTYGSYALGDNASKVDYSTYLNCGGSNSSLSGKSVLQGDGVTVDALSFGNTYTIGTTTGSLKNTGGDTKEYVTCKKATADDDGRTAAADSGFAGNWYNWYAATAGTGDYEKTGVEATDSICPTNWHLPSDSPTSDHSFTNLIVATCGIKVGNYSSPISDSINHGNDYFRNADTPLLSFPLSYIRSGLYYFSNGGLNGRGSYGFFWSSYASSTANARGLGFVGRNLSPQAGNGKGYGFAVRCVAR